MRRSRAFVPTVVFAAVLVFGCFGSQAEEVAVPTDATVLNGSYESTSWGDGPLEAVFTPAGEGWSVDFHFTFDGQAHTYSGTATGSLEDGSLSGEVKNESRRRTFSFEGTVEDGVFVGTHAEIRRERARATGTMTLG